MKTGEIQEIPIEVSARIIRHISRGIYRTPAGALKELVSNAYDAGAKKVTINTGYPVVEKIIITDNGAGMGVEEFKKIIQQIGLSEKIAGTEFQLPGSDSTRVTVGHYGIGMLAIGQLCKQARIISKKEGSLEGFEALIDFDQFEIKTEEGIKRSIVKDEKIIEKGDKEDGFSDDKKLPIGMCKLGVRKYALKDKVSHFTRIELEIIRDLVQKKLSGNLLEGYKDLKKKVEYSADFFELLRIVTAKDDYVQHGQYPYEKLCWELALYSPVRYPNLKVFNKGGELHEFQNLTGKSEFSLVIDGMEIYKPYERVFFEDKKYPIRKTFVWLNEEFVNDYRVSGYLIYRQRIRPKGLQGILVRESGVAVGMHGQTFLEYPYREGAKFEQLTGELFAHGLSGALNIDRNSFNETDDTYLALVKWFHKKLHDEVFRYIQKTISARRRDASKDVLKLVSSYFRAIGRKNRVQLVQKGRKERLFYKNDRVIFINTEHPLGKPSRAAVERLSLSVILISQGVVTPENMENILKDMTKAKKRK